MFHWYEIYKAMCFLPVGLGAVKNGFRSRHLQATQSVIRHRAAERARAGVWVVYCCTMFYCLSARIEQMNRALLVMMLLMLL